jgi:hypothetical protein
LQFRERGIVLLIDVSLALGWRSELGQDVNYYQARILVFAAPLLDLIDAALVRARNQMFPAIHRRTSATTS